jgi:hypothetical protein
MSKVKGVVLGEGHVNHVGPAGALIGNREGFTPGTPQGTKSTVLDQFRGSGINTAPNPVGTPLQDVDGNPDETRRVAEGTGRYGVVLSENGQDHNNFASNGDGVILDKMSKDYADAAHKPTLDSPVPREAPLFETDNIIEENRAHLGKGSGPTAPNDDMSRDDLMKIGGVMSR